MKNLKVSCTIVAALLAILCVTLLFSHPTSSHADTSQASIPRSSKLGPITQYPAGVPAITPTNKLVTVTNNPTVNISTNDVTQFVISFGMPRCSIVNNGHATVLDVRLVTAQQASVILEGENIGRPDSAMVYYVKVLGPFETSAGAPPSSNIATSVQQSANDYGNTSIGEMVFDASTGNLLVWGFPPQ